MAVCASIAPRCWGQKEHDRLHADHSRAQCRCGLAAVQRPRRPSGALSRAIKAPSRAHPSRYPTRMKAQGLRAEKAVRRRQGYGGKGAGSQPYPGSHHTILIHDVCMWGGWGKRALTLKSNHHITHARRTAVHACGARIPGQPISHISECISAMSTHEHRARPPPPPESTIRE